MTIEEKISFLADVQLRTIESICEKSQCEECPLADNGLCRAPTWEGESYKKLKELRDGK